MQWIDASLTWLQDAIQAEIHDPAAPSSNEIKASGAQPPMDLFQEALPEDNWTYSLAPTLVKHTLVNIPL